MIPKSTSSLEIRVGIHKTTYVRLMIICLIGVPSSKSNHYSLGESFVRNAQPSLSMIIISF
jgi:hypothetical protein